MGIIVNIGEERSELQKRIASDLREKQERKGLDDPNKTPIKTDFDKPEFSVEDSSYMKDFKKESLPGWVWAFVIIFMIIILVSLIIVLGGGKK